MEAKNTHWLGAVDGELHDDLLGLRALLRGGLTGGGHFDGSLGGRERGRGGVE